MSSPFRYSSSRVRRIHQRRLAAELVDSISAPSKAFVTIPNAGHFAVFMKSNEFLQVLVSRVLPLAKDR